MPLVPGHSKEVISKNIHELSQTGRPHAQVIAIALHNAGYHHAAKAVHPKAAELHASHSKGEPWDGAE